MLIFATMGFKSQKLAYFKARGASIPYAETRDLAMSHPARMSERAKRAFPKEKRSDGPDQEVGSSSHARRGV